MTHFSRASPCTRRTGSGRSRASHGRRPWWWGAGVRDAVAAAHEADGLEQDFSVEDIKVALAPLLLTEAEVVGEVWGAVQDGRARGVGVGHSQSLESYVVIVPSLVAISREATGL